MMRQLFMVISQGQRKEIDPLLNHTIQVDMNGLTIVVKRIWDQSFLNLIYL